MLTVTELTIMLRATIGNGQRSGRRRLWGSIENDFEPVGNSRGIGDRDHSRCCLRQLDGVCSHTNAHAGAYRYTGTHTNAHAGAYGHTRAQSYAHTGAYRYTGAQSAERIGRGGAYRYPGDQPTSGH